MVRIYDMKKKSIFLLLIVSAAFVMLCGCAKEKSSENTEAKQLSINIGCMKGPTGIGMIKLLNDSDEGKSVNHYNYTIAGTADEISTALVKEKLDIAAVPCNLASVLYNKTEGEVVTVAINTLGVLYIVENGKNISEVSDLKGKTIYSTGQGTTPEYTLRYLLTKAGLNPDKDVNIQYKSEAPEVLAAMTQDESSLAMLPQPYVTVALNSNENYRIALNVTEEWEKLSKDSSVVTGVLVVRKSFIEKNKEMFDEFIKEYKASTEYANTNVEETAALLEKYDIFKAAIAKKAIPFCNVTFINGEEMKTKAYAYLKVIYDQNPNAVGGKLEEGMFYID